jgi:hypothetical protein
MKIFDAENKAQWNETSTKIEKFIQETRQRELANRP